MNRNETASSGMGLYLVHSVKDQLGIDVKVESEVGQEQHFISFFHSKMKL